LQLGFFLGGFAESEFAADCSVEIVALHEVEIVLESSSYVIVEIVSIE